MALDPAIQVNRLEQGVLRALCHGTTEGSVREFARAALQNYRWREPVHQAIFEALLAIPSDSSEIICAELPARLTRMGFPDVDCETLFKGKRLSKREAEGLMVQLKEQGRVTSDE
jgi:hypothetical protein